MFDTRVPDMPEAKPNSASMVWSRTPLQPLAAGVLTPFSYSVLAELYSRGWYVYYDQLGFAPAPRSQLLRRHKGHAYLNLSLSAQLDADQAGLEPVTLPVNGQRHPLAIWEKPGFLAGFKTGRAQRKIDEMLAHYGQQMEGARGRASAWVGKTQGIRWGQAEILQIMEEIERVGTESMAVLVAARHQLERIYATLLDAMLLDNLNSHLPRSHAILLINNALDPMPELIETQIAHAVAELQGNLRDPASIAWLQAGDFSQWRTTLPNQAAQTQLAAFLSAYGHRALADGEIANPRWDEAPELLLRWLGQNAGQTPTQPAQWPVNEHRAKLLAQLPAAQRKLGQQLLQKLCELHHLQSTALHVFAYILAGTRRWVLAAAREAMTDQRLLTVEDVFYFELEEIKQMMTGEWNVSARDEIRAKALERRAIFATWQQERAPDMLIGDQEGYHHHTGLPGVAGQASGTLLRNVASGNCVEAGGTGHILGVDALTSGWAMTLPLARGVVAAHGTPLDPCVVAARAWQHPIAVGLGADADKLVEGAATTLDVSVDHVTVSQEASQ